MHAVKGSLGHSLNERYRESEGSQREISHAPYLRDNEQVWREHLYRLTLTLTGLTIVPRRGNM